MAKGREAVRELVLQAIMTGDAPPGAPLNVKAIAEQLSISAIPVREILSRMVGEGILVDRRGIGFFVPKLHAHDLIQVYRLRLLLIVGASDRALKKAAAAAGPGTGQKQCPPMTMDSLFGALVMAADDTMLAFAWARTDYRLLPYRRCEPDLDPAPASGARSMSEAIAMRDTALVKRIATRFIRAREGQCDAILRCAEAGEIS